jgi:hypothetical protein
MLPLLAASHRYKTKPPQWGPLSEVEANIKRQLDAMGLPHPTGYWPLWEMSGLTIHDYSGKGNHGSLIQDIPWVRNTIYSGGNYESIEIPNAIDIVSSSGTALFGYKKRSALSAYYLYFFYVEAYNKFSLFCYTSLNNLSFSDNQENTDESLRNYEYHDFACAWQASRWDSYIDGYYYAGRTQSYSPSFSSSDLLHLTGRDDEVDRYNEGLNYYYIFFDEVLTEEQIYTFQEQPYRPLYYTPPTRYFHVAGGTTVSQSVAGSLGSLSGALGETVTFSQVLQGSI